MTGMLKTYTNKDIKPRTEDKKKNHIDSYNPGTSSRELNPYWKDGGTGLPQTAESFRKSRPFLKPVDDDDDYYSKSSTSKEQICHKSSESGNISHYNKGSRYHKQSERKTYNWKTHTETNSSDPDRSHEEYKKLPKSSKSCDTLSEKKESKKESLYLSDEKMNKLGAKIVKAEIMGDSKLVAELKAKLEAAREYRKQNPDAGEEEDEGVMLISTNNSGNSMPLTKSEKGDPRSKGGKRKAETHNSGERMKYFGNDDKYNLAQMVS